MPREIRSALLRYGLALASFGLILVASFVFERILPFWIDLTSANAAGYQTHINRPVDPTKLAAAVADLGRKARKNPDGNGK